MHPHIVEAKLLFGSNHCFKNKNKVFISTLHNSDICRISQSSILFYIICWALLHEKGYQVLASLICLIVCFIFQMLKKWKRSSGAWKFDRIFKVLIIIKSSLSLHFPWAKSQCIFTWYFFVQNIFLQVLMCIS